MEKIKTKSSPDPASDPLFYETDLDPDQNETDSQH